MTYDVSINPSANSAKKILMSRFDVGQMHQSTLVSRVAALHIKDKLVPPTNMQIIIDSSRPALEYLPSDTRVRIHPHALSQMYTACGFKSVQAREYFNLKEPWAEDLIAYNMNELFHKRKFASRSKEPKKFLHRLVEVGGKLELRGFLSRNYNRMLASLPLLRGFVESCNAVGAQPTEASTSDVFFSLKSFLPYVFEPIPNELVALGVKWSNSDFGYGRLSVGLCAMRISSGGTIVFEDSLSRRHIGSVIQDSDLEMSEETAMKEVQAQLSAINDVIMHLLSAESVNRILRSIREAHENELPWAKMKSELSSFLSLPDIESMKDLMSQDIIDLPEARVFNADDGRAPTRWWVSNALARMASTETSVDRKEELQAAAGAVLNLPRSFLSTPAE